MREGEIARGTRGRGAVVGGSDLVGDIGGSGMRGGEGRV